MSENENYDDWLSEWLRIKKPMVKVSTYVRYKNIVDNHIKPYLGKYSLNQMTTPLLEEFVIHAMTKGRMDGCGGLSAKSISDILVIIKDTFRFAQSYGAPTSCNFDCIRIRKTGKEMRILTRIEEKRLVNILLENINRYKAGILISLYTGIRIGELCALKGKHISLEERTIRIEQTMQRLQRLDDSHKKKTHIIISEPKSSCSKRTIPISDALMTILMSFQTEQDSFFLSGTAQVFVEPRTMQNHFKTVIKNCGIENVTFHSLRHTFATRCVEVGFDVKSLSEILGHSSVKITLDRYVHSSLEQKRKCMEKLQILG